MIKMSTEHLPPDSYDTVSTITHPEQHSTQYIVAEPNQSASWQTNKLLILALGIPCALIATTFSMAGAWLLIPFAGLEITGLGAALYIVCRRLRHKHVLIFNNQKLRIEKGSSKAEQVWHFSVRSLTLGVERQHHPWDAIKITLCGHDTQGNYQHISVGEFLNKQDSHQLLKALRKQGLRVGNDSQSLLLDM